MSWMAYGLGIFRKSTLECRRPGTDLGILRKANLNSTLGSANTPGDSLSFAVPQQNLLCKATAEVRADKPVRRHGTHIKQRYHSFLSSFSDMRQIPLP